MSEGTATPEATDEDHAPADLADPAALAATVLEEEIRREEEQASKQGDDDVLLPDDLLPGVGDEKMSMREVVRRGGVSTIAVLAGLNIVDEFDRAAVAVLAPDIQRSLGVSDTLIAVLSTIGGVLIVLAFIPVGYLADRTRRMTLISGVSGILGTFMLLTGFVQNAWQFAATRIGTGFGKGGNPAFQSVLADRYPIAGRARIFAIYNGAQPIGLLLGPVLAGAIAGMVAGPEGWRWAFILLAIPTLVLGLLSLFLKEPRRGHNEQVAIFGEENTALTHEKPSLGAAFERLRKIKTFYYILVGLGVVGFGLFAFGIFFSLFLEEHFGLEALQRGYVMSLAAIGGLLGAPVGGILADRYFRKNPPAAVVVTALLLMLFGAGVIAMYMPNLTTLVMVAAIGQLGIVAAVSGLLAILASVMPFRMRGMGYALAGLYMLFIGGFLGALITGQLSDAFGPRVALTVVIPPAMIVGAATMAYGARFVRHDISAAASELLEEQREHERVKQGGDIPVLQVRNVDFSYGQVQVLFDVSLDVWEGETLALLGTNGAGKSTLLKAVSGLALPDSGVIRLDGHAITLADSTVRVRQGIVQVPGGQAIFPSMSVHENLLMGAHTYIWDRKLVRERIDRAVETFPRLSERMGQPAGTLSGGEQQMLAIAKGLLLEPRLLLIDELSLGLAPVVVQDLLEIIERLKAQGLTMIIVEQSVNVALQLADRAIFMEKGRVRFEGPAQDLLERDDLVRAVFLGSEGG